MKYDSYGSLVWDLDRALDEAGFGPYSDQRRDIKAAVAHIVEYVSEGRWKGRRVLEALDK